MGSVRVVVLDVGVEDALQVAAALDQCPVQAVEAVMADGAHEPLGEGVRSGCSRRCADHPHVLGSEHVVEARVNFASRSRMSSRIEGQIVAHGQVAGLLGDPGTVGVAGNAGEMHVGSRAR